MKVFRNTVCVVFITIWIPLFSALQAKEGRKIAIKPNEPIKNLVMNQWTGDDGLISNNLTSVCQSDDGFLWISSFNGIHRFDGNSFFLFDKENVPQLKSNGIYRCYNDSDGNIWFATQGSGLLKYHAGKFERMGSDEDLPLSVRCVFVASDKKIWAGTNNKGLYYSFGQGFMQLSHPKLDQISIYDIVETADHSIWIATAGSGLLRYKDGSFTEYSIENGLNSNRVNALFESGDGELLVGTQLGLSRIRNGEIRDCILYDDNEINDILCDDNGTIWLATELGLERINDDLSSRELFSEKDGLPAKQISTFCFDHEGSLWLSTKKAGLLRFKDSNFTNFTIKNGLSSNRVNIIVEHKGLYYIGCDNGKINVIDSDNITPFNIKTESYNAGIRDICFDDNETMWIANYRGLLKVKDGREVLIDLKRGLPAIDIRRLFIDSKKNIWIGTRTGGLIKYDGENHFEVFDHNSPIGSDFILDIEEDKRGNILVGTHSNGVTVISSDGQMKNIMVENGRTGVLIFNIYVDETPNTYWFSTNVGIYRYQNKEIRKIVFDKQYKTETFFDFIKDRNEDIWLTSNIGILKVNNADINAFLDSSITYVPVRVFDNSDGMYSKECTGATRSLLSSNGKLWIPTLGGVARIDPENISINTIIPKVYITDFIVDFNSVNRDEEKIVIDPGRLYYQFKYTALSLMAPSKVRFKYRLSGFDKDWAEVINDREVAYTNIPAGNYKFMVMASNNDGYWNAEPVSISFRVKPYFYKTIVFYIAMAILIVFLLWLVFYLRTRAIKHRNEELTRINDELDRFVYSASHDLRAPLASVLGLADIAGRESAIEAKDQCLTMIKDSVTKLDDFTKDIIDFSRNQRVALTCNEVDLMNEVKEIFKELQYLDNNSKIEKIVDYNEHRVFRTDRRRISVILKNLIGNAIKYHDLNKENPYIRVTIQYFNRRAEITVEDNGLGIEKAHLKKIFNMFYRATDKREGSGLGLYIVKETIEKLDAKISVYSTPGKGSEFRVSIPSCKK